jgi:hypothetical protein
MRARVRLSEDQYWSDDVRLAAGAAWRARETYTVKGCRLSDTVIAYRDGVYILEANVTEVEYAALALAGVVIEPTATTEDAW